MTIEKIEDTKPPRADWLVSCNGTDCKESLDAKNRTFGQTVVFTKARCWKIRKEHGTWHHYCPNCQ